jgi:Flp pilus assembly protein TadG
MLRHRTDAISTITFALIAPIFLLIVFGTMETARVFNNWMIITNEAREAARFGAVTFNGAQDPATRQATERAAVTAFISQRLNGVLDQTYLLPPPDVTVTTDARPKIQVTIYYQVPLVVPLVSQILPNPFPIAARSAMQGE